MSSDTIKDIAVDVKRCPDCGARFGFDAAFCPFDGTALKHGTWDPGGDPLTGTVVDGRYEVVAPLGEGGMGTVYEVRHITLQRAFAMKVLRRDLAADPELAARFTQEARATAAIKHPGVVQITDFGALDEGAPFFVMELLVGQTLATRLRARGPLPPEAAVRVGRRIADALAASHAANVVHRDLKPENVFLVGESHGKAAVEDVRIVDFGAAKIVGASKLTRPGIVFGTPYYMSPEQASGQSVDARADIYSLGVLLYEMVTGVVPFEADTYMGVLTKHMFAAPVRPSERVPSGVSLGSLEAVILRALEKDATVRYASMAELATELESAARALAAAPAAAPAVHVQRTQPLPFSPLSTADRIQQSVSRRVDEDRRRRLQNVVVAVLAGAALLATVAGAVIALDARGRARPSSPSSSVASTGASAAGTVVAVATSSVSAAAPSPRASTADAAGEGTSAPPAPTASSAPGAPHVPSAPAAPLVTVRPRPGGEPARSPTSGGPAPKAPPPGSSTPPTTAPTTRRAGPDEFTDPWKR